MKKQHQHFAKLLSGIALLAIFSCKKDAAPIPGTQQPLIKLAKIEQVGKPSPVIEVQYNAQNLISKLKQAAVPEAATTFAYIDNKPTKAETKYAFEQNVHYTSLYLYNGDKLDKVYVIYTGFDPNNLTPQMVYKYIYQSNQLYQAIIYGGGEEATNVISRTTYAYFANGDLKTQSTENRNPDDSYSPYAAVAYEYDTNVNPLKTQSQYFLSTGTFIHRNTHNITKETHTEGADSHVTSVVSRAFTYDAHSFPVSVTETTTFPSDPQEPTETATYKYTYIN